MGPEAEEIAERVRHRGTFSVEKFVRRFPVLVEVGGGANRLKGLVIEIAIRGRLSGPAATDEPVDRQLARILHEKSVTSRNSSTDDTMTVETPPFDVPSHWRWVRWRDLVLSTGSGWSPQCENRPREDHEWGVLKVSAVSWLVFQPEENKALPAGIEPRVEFAAHAGDFLMSRANTADLVGRSVIVAEDPKRLILSDKLVRCKFSKDVEQQYVNLYNRTTTARAHYLANASGTSDSMKNISRDVILAMPIPLPPLAEQKRIVARVDQLMALIDQLEAKRTRKRDLGARYTKASLEALTTAESPQDFTTAWTRIHQSWPTLLDHSDEVGDVRRAILEMGVQGCLARQLPSDEPASALLARVQLAGTDLEDAGDNLPRGWERVQLGRLAVVKSGTTLAPELELATGDWPYLKIADMNLPGNEKEAVLSSRYVRESDELRRYLIDPGSIIFPKRGGAIATNKKRIVRRPILVDLNTMAITCPPEMCFDFVYLWFLTIDLAELDNGTSVPQINHKDICPLVLPVPPLAEQKRIVAKVEHLMKLCDALEAALRRSEDRAAKLTEALVREMVA